MYEQLLNKAGGKPMSINRLSSDMQKLTRPPMK